MRYDREAEWLLNTCNDCRSYCFCDDSILGAKMRTFANVEEWRNAFDETGDIWLLHLAASPRSIRISSTSPRSGSIN